MDNDKHRQQYVIKLPYNLQWFALQMLHLYQYFLNEAVHASLTVVIRGLSERPSDFWISEPISATSRMHTTLQRSCDTWRRIRKADKFFFSQAENEAQVLMFSTDSYDKDRLSRKTLPEVFEVCMQNGGQYSEGDKAELSTVRGFHLKTSRFFRTNHPSP